MRKAHLELQRDENMHGSCTTWNPVMKFGERCSWNKGRGSGRDYITVVGCGSAAIGEKLPPLPSSPYMHLMYKDNKLMADHTPVGPPSSHYPVWFGMDDGWWMQITLSVSGSSSFLQLIICGTLVLSSCYLMGIITLIAHSCEGGTWQGHCPLRFPSKYNPSSPATWHMGFQNLKAGVVQKLKAGMVQNPKAVMVQNPKAGVVTIFKAFKLETMTARVDSLPITCFQNVRSSTPVRAYDWSILSN